MIQQMNRIGIVSYRQCSVYYFNYLVKKVLLILPFLSDVFPPDSAPNGSAPVGVSPLSWSTDSDSSL